MELLGILTRLVIYKSGAAPYTAKTGNLKHTTSSLKAHDLSLLILKRLYTSSIMFQIALQITFCSFNGEMSRLFQRPTFQNPVNSFHPLTNMKDCYIDPFVSTKYVYFGLPPPAFHSFHSWVCQTAPDGTLRHLRGTFKQTHCNSHIVIHIA